MDIFSTAIAAATSAAESFKPGWKVYHNQSQENSLSIALFRNGAWGSVAEVTVSNGYIDARVYSEIGVYCTYHLSVGEALVLNVLHGIVANSVKCMYWRLVDESI